MKKILFILGIAVVFIAASCKKNITDLNINPTRPQRVPSASLFSNAELNLSDLMAHTNVNFNNFRLFVQYWTETIYRDETRYNLNQRSISDRWWATLYRDVIKDLSEASVVAETETLTLSPEEIQNRKAINEILIVYSYYVLVTSFGNIPYEEALDIDKLQPVYDDAATVFGKLATRLDAAIADLDLSSPAYGSADLILDDDIEGWERFAYSLKFTMGMLLLDSDFSRGSAMVTDAAPHVVSSNSENIMMHYLSSPPNTNPVWEDLVQSGRHDFIAARPFMDSLKKYNDPRLPFYFDPTVTDPSRYLGETPGIRATFNNFSGPSVIVANPENPHAFFSYAEMELLKAEAVERGIAIGGTAAAHYTEGVEASVVAWGGTVAEAATYLSQPGIAYATAPGNYKQKIGLQLWFALYNRGYDAWTQWRRLDYPLLQVPDGALFASGEAAAVIKRMTYPVIEQNLNKASYESASAAIGGDRITQKLWFDVY